MKSIRLSKECIAWLDGVRCLRLDGRTIRAMFSEQPKFVDVVKCETKESTKDTFIHLVRQLRGDYEPMLRPHSAQPDKYKHGYIVYDNTLLHMDGVCLVRSNHRSPSITITYKDGCGVTLRFDDNAAVYKALDEIARIVDGIYDDEQFFEPDEQLL